MGDFEDQIRQIKKQSDQKKLKHKEAIIRQQYKVLLTIQTRISQSFAKTPNSTSLYE